MCATTPRAENNAVIPKRPKPLIMITGYQRSGTSFLTRALNLCGLYLGEAEELSSTEINPDPTIVSVNPRGSWESEKLMSVLYPLFPKLDRTNPVNLPEDMENVPPISDELVLKLKYFVSRLMQHRPSLASGTKLPYPLIVKAILPHLPADTVIVGIFRHPLKVVDSILRNRHVPQSRWGILRTKFLRLWKLHNQALLDIMDNHTYSFLVNFDWPKVRLLSEIHVIARKIGLVETNLELWYSEELKRSDRYVDINSTSALDEYTKEIYSRLLQRAEKNNDIKSLEFEQSKDTLKKIIKELNEQNSFLSHTIYQLTSDQKKTSPSNLSENNTTRDTYWTGV